MAIEVLVPGVPEPILVEIATGVAETTASILEKIGSGGVIRPAFFPGALQVGADPNLLTISGVTTPAASYDLTLTLEGFYQWSGEPPFLQWAAGEWRVSHEDGAWVIRKTVGFTTLFRAEKVSASLTPVGLTGWVVTTGSAAALSISGNDQVASYVGELGQGGPFWFLWNGSAWVEDAAGGGVTEHSALSGLAVGDDHPQYALADGSRGAFAPASGIALNAIYGTAVATGDSRLSNERTPTTVGLANKLFYQPAATTNDSFAIPVSENSVVVKRLTFLALWDWITGKLGALTSLTAGGAWSFSGQIASSGSTDATVSTNVVNVATNDARYGRFYFAKAASSTVVNNSTALVDVGCEITLPAGTYRVSGMIISNHNTAAGSKLQLTLSASCIVFGCLYRGVTGARAVPTTLTTGSASSLTAIETSGTDNHASCQFTVVIASDTTLKWQQAQNIAYATDSTTAAGAWLMAEKIE